MATQKPISTISYNSEAFLKERLDAWLDAHIIQAYQYICHKGEDGDKDHIHVRLEPNKKLDPMDLAEQLREYVMGQDKPLGCRPFRPSKEEDWILYAVHDADYLRLKYGGGEKGEKLPYEWTDIRVPENYDMEVAFIRARAHMSHTTANMASRIQSGTDPLELVLTGENVFHVNAIMRTLSTNDYERLTREHSQLQSRFDKLVQAIEAFGCTITEDDEGNISIS